MNNKDIKNIVSDQEFIKITEKLSKEKIPNGLKAILLSSIIFARAVNLKRNTAMKNKFCIKDESVYDFLCERISGFALKRETNPYYFLKDKLYFKKSNDIAEGDKVEFILSDTTHKGCIKIENQYVYEVCNYDSQSYELNLVEFNIKPVK